VSLLGEASAFPADVYPWDFHGLPDQSDERGADGKPLLQFYAAIALLARDMHLYLQAHPRDDATLFEEIVEKVHAEERTRFDEDAFPVYRHFLPEGFSFGLAQAAAAGQPSLEHLASPEIVHEWSSRPGALLYHSFVSALDRLGLRQRICGKGGLHEQYTEHHITFPDLQVVLVTSIVTLSASAAAFWAPLAVLISVILVRRGLDHYCGHRLH
jgi:hypothetical protein